MEKLVVSLKQLLEAEISNAARKAKSLGLKSGGYGKWVDANGVTKGRTENGEFVPVQDKEKTTPDKPHKPATMTAKQAGHEKPLTTTPMNPDGTKKLSAKSAVKKSEKDMKDVESDSTFQPTVQNIELNQNNPLVRRNNNALWRKHPPANPLELEAVIPPGTDVLSLRKEVIPGETSYLFTDNTQYSTAIAAEFPHYYQKRTDVEGAFPLEILPDSEWIVRKDALNEIAAKQAQTWRKNLDEKTQLRLLDVQSEWQYHDKRELREEFGEAIQQIIDSAPEKPHVETTEPICRGMHIAIDDAKNFLSNFGIGREIEMPVSSFSLSPGVTRNFVSFYDGTDRDSDQISVFLRVFPNKENKVYGLTMNKPYTPETAFIQTQWPKSNNFENEFEIVRFPGTKAKCINIEKLITSGKIANYEYTKFTYIIDMEEMGPQQKEIQESVNAMDDGLYREYMQKPMYKLKKKVKLKDMMPKEEAKEKGVPFTDSDAQDYLYGAKKNASDLRTSTVI